MPQNLPFNPNDPQATTITITASKIIEKLNAFRAAGGVDYRTASDYSTLQAIYEQYRRLREHYGDKIQRGYNKAHVQEVSKELKAQCDMLLTLFAKCIDNIKRSGSDSAVFQLKYLTEAHELFETLMDAELHWLRSEGLAKL